MRVLIVDDEQPARDRLRQLIDDAAQHEVVGEAGNGADALQLAGDLQPDVVLLDIRMPGMDGIETAHHLNAMDRPPAVVFATAYDEYAIEAFDARAIGYVMKPVRRQRLARALEQAARLSGGQLQQLAGESGLESRRRHVCAHVHGELKLIPIDSVNLFRADQKYVCVHHDNGQVLIDDSLKSLETEFADAFVRIHRGMLVRVDRIDRIEKTPSGKSRIVLRDGSHGDGEDLIISRRHVADVRRRLQGIRKGIRKGHP